MLGQGVALWAEVVVVVDIECASLLLGMKREVRPSRFQVNSGNPALAFVSPFSLEAEPQPGVHALPAPDRRGARVPASARPHPGLADQLHSARKLEDEECQQLARAWVVCAKRVRNAGAIISQPICRTCFAIVPLNIKEAPAGLAALVIFL